jgi:hypothetical protein
MAFVETAGAGGVDPAIAVVVGRAMGPQFALSPIELLGIYGRKRRLWEDGTSIVAVNLPASHALRRSFSMAIFKRSPEDLQSYWNDQYFHGVVPPPVLASEEAVLRFVSSTPGAVGYVSSCLIDKRVMVVALIPNADGAAACLR